MGVHMTKKQVYNIKKDIERKRELHISFAQTGQAPGRCRMD